MLGRVLRGTGAAERVARAITGFGIAAHT